MSELTEVPSDKVPDEVRNCILLGATRIEVVKQPNGNWTVRCQ